MEREPAKKRRGIYLLPNLLTTGSMFSGFFSMVSTLDGRYETAAIAIVIAGIFDNLDGKAARLTKTTTKFGIEYDSISDVLSFGAAPALLIYSWALHAYGRVGWIAAFLFLVCSALRLARFNVQVETVEKKSFTGLPTPGAAGMIATTVLFNHHMNDLMGDQKGLVMLLLTYLLAFLMVSNIPYVSSKEFGLAQRRPFSVLVSYVLFFIMLAAMPEITLFGFGALYVSSGLLMLVVKQFVKAPEPEKAPVSEDIE